MRRASIPRLCFSKNGASFIGLTVEPSYLGSAKLFHGPAEVSSWADHPEDSSVPLWPSRTNHITHDRPRLRAPSNLLESHTTIQRSEAMVGKEVGYPSLLGFNCITLENAAPLPAHIFHRCFQQMLGNSSTSPPFRNKKAHHRPNRLAIHRLQESGAFQPWKFSSWCH